MKLSVIGTGYLGATHAAAMASLGFDVVGVDVDPKKIELLKVGKVPFFEPDLEELLIAEVNSGRLKFTTDFSEAKDWPGRLPARPVVCALAEASSLNGC